MAVRNRTNRIRSDSTNEIHKTLFLYWFILVVWQNVQVYSALSGFDLIVKLGLTILLAWRFLDGRNLMTQGWNAAAFLLFAITMAITAVFNIKDLTLRIVIQYFFPVFLIFLVYISGNDFEISYSDYSKYLDWVIYVVLYMSLYSFIFKRDFFANALSSVSAYDNALSSFLVSNHEYGMYLLFGICACLYQLSNTGKRKLFYWISIICFLINLIATYSRTSQVATIGFFIIYLFFSKKKGLKVAFVILFAVAIFAVLNNPQLRSYFDRIVIRQDNFSGRTDLWSYGLQVFRESNWGAKLFGHGYGADVITSTGHASLHNAYLQVLLTNGIFGLLFLIIAIVAALANAIRFCMIDRDRGIYSLALIIAAAALMLSNTAVIFYSPICDAMLTFFCVVIPKYLYNYRLNHPVYKTELQPEASENEPELINNAADTKSLTL